MDKIEISIELLQEIQEELRTQRIVNMELHGQLMAVRRCLQQVQYHMPKDSEVEYVPTVMTKINETIEKHLKKAPQVENTPKKVSTKKIQ